MAITDADKCQHLIDVVAGEAINLKAVADKLDALVVLFQTHNPDVTGTPLEGQVANVNAWITTVRQAADGPVATGMIAAKSSRHRPNIALA